MELRERQLRSWRELTLAERLPHARHDALFHSVPIMTLCKQRCLQDPHFTDGQTEAERGQVTGIKSRWV